MRASGTRAPVPAAPAAGAVTMVAAAMVMLVGAMAPANARGVTYGGAFARHSQAVPARGIDVSAFQHPGGARIDWPSVAQAGYRFAFIKETEGRYYVNPYFHADAAAAKAAGLLVAAYHFANPARSGGAAQADYALDHGAYTADGRTLPLVLDIERDPYLGRACYGLGPRQMVSWIAAFMAQAHRRTGIWPVINTQPAWWDTCTGHTRAFAAYQLWVQYPKAGATSPGLPSGWAHWAYWQYSITGQVQGVTGNTDLNELNPALLAVADPGDQSYQAGHRVRVLVRSVNGASGQALSYAAAGLPSGLIENRATGVISGTLPSHPGSSAVAVTVSAAGASPVTWHFAWHVHGKVTITTPATQAGRVGSQVKLAVRASDGLRGCTLRFTATGLPPGLSVSRCGLITGRPTRAGTYRPVIRVTDSSKSSLASASFTWKVA